MTAKSPYTPEMVSAPELDFSEFVENDVVTFRYWSVQSKRPIPDVGEVVDSNPGGHEPASITVKNEAGKPRTIYETGRVDSHYRQTEQSQTIGHDARIRTIDAASAEQ